MAVIQVFAMNNPKSTCTAAALTWCYMLLAKSATPAAHHFLPTDDTMKRNMDNISDLDNNTEKQVAIMHFDIVAKEEAGPYTSAQIAQVFKDNPPHVGIFWNSFHTMGYSYSHNDKYYFDNNSGLYKAKKTKHVTAKMDEIALAGQYGTWDGYCVVRLSPRFKM